MSGWIAALITLGILAVTTAGYLGIRAAFQSNKNTQTITNYEKSLASWKERAESAEADRDQCKLSMLAKEAQRAALEQKYVVLQDVVSGAAEIERVGGEVKQYVAEVAGRLEILEGIFNSMDPKISEALKPGRRRPPAVHEGEPHGPG